jgi:Transposase DDE domain group 1
MQTECTPKLFEFEAVERRSVVAGFDGGNITSNAGALLLGQVDRGVGLVRRFAACFTDRRDPRYVEHQVETLVGQRIFGLALGYEDLNDHDELRKDPTFAVLAGKLSPVLRTDCEPLGRTDLLAVDVLFLAACIWQTTASAGTFSCPSGLRRRSCIAAAVRAAAGAARPPGD